MSTLATTQAPLKAKISRDDWLQRAAILVIAVYLIITLAMPLYVMLSKSLQNHAGEFIGFGNYGEYFTTPALVYSIQNSLFIAVLSTLISVSIAFLFAYALTR
ncbi:MAG: putative 2-aminoethylphosphonate ABC transporter permease subunit, partial [Candidatus Competibacteraceae bacterium]|nr:putative 2-aminoethylphosphonate ABC transporter permease subunit [Candidatus Competibacteraceae bacterium]